MPPLRRPTAPQVCVLGVLALALALPATASAQPPAGKLGIATIGGLHTLEFRDLPAGRYVLRARLMSKSEVLGTAVGRLVVTGMTDEP